MFLLYVIVPLWRWCSMVWRRCRKHRWGDV